MSSQFQKKSEKWTPRRGIEPRSPAWQAGILTTILTRISWWAPRARGYINQTLFFWSGIFRVSGANASAGNKINFFSIWAYPGIPRERQELVVLAMPAYRQVTARKGRSRLTRSQDCQIYTVVLLLIFSKNLPSKFLRSLYQNNLDSWISISECYVLRPLCYIQVPLKPVTLDLM